MNPNSRLFTNRSTYVYTKQNLQIENDALIVIRFRTFHFIPACVEEQRDNEDIREAYTRSNSPQKSFVQYFRSTSNKGRHDTRREYDMIQNDMKLGIEVEVHHVIFVKVKTTTHKKDVALSSSRDR